MDQGKLSSIHQVTKSPPAKINLQKKDKFRVQQLRGKVTVKQAYLGKRATQNLLINHQVMKTTKH